MSNQNDNNTRFSIRFSGREIATAIKGGGLLVLSWCCTQFVNEVRGFYHDRAEHRARIVALEQSYREVTIPRIERLENKPAGRESRAIREGPLQ